MHNESMKTTVSAVTAAITLLTVPSVSGLVGQLRKRQPRNDGTVYEDKDGKATPESIAAFSNKTSKAAIFFFAALGAASSLVASVLATFSEGRNGPSIEGWFLTASWFLILGQAVSIAAIRQCTMVYTFGTYAFFSGVIQAFVIVNKDMNEQEGLRHGDDVLILALRIAELVAIAGLLVSSILVPRRPTVYYEDEPVDGMFTTSAYGRYTYAWPIDLIRLSKKKKTLEVADLPRPNHNIRSRDVSAFWKAKQYPADRLWLSIVRANATAFALQWILTLVTSILNFGPQWVILQLLRILETRNPSDPIGIKAWIWVLWLGIVIATQSLVEAYVYWLSVADLLNPVRAQLSALIFEKAMRRKDVKESVKKEKEAKASDSADAPAGGENTPEGGNDANKDAKKTKEDGDDDDELETVKKTKQGTVNLIGVDCKRISDFCSYQNLFPGSLFKLIVSLAFLIELLGWIPLLAGFSAIAAIMPLNIHFSRLYSDAQDKLMKLRDEKLEVVTEALQGIRQIKFSALEGQWEKKIGEVRDRELTSVWNVFKYDTVLFGCWITSPVALSAISLAVYAWVNGELTPSVAFVSLGVFRGLEVTLSLIPELTTDLLDAWVSVKRVQDYLLGPDRVKVSLPSDEISFENASIAWPSDDDSLDESDRFVLRNINVTFPPGELSVISGKTGTGKSLMLAAILGEIDLLAGKLHVPEGLSVLDRHDAKATKDNWILPKSIAYIAQIPWIENATIQDNIIFGLPFDETRYQKTIDVCALSRDLEMLPDGEKTEIGANGINLSGGQKWRITLARAIYSRAGILVMDDIFSAVDAHVGRHIFEKCINGELCAGRTRILVTHHVALCAPKTKFLVELGDGGVLHAGLLSELAEQGALERIKTNEETPDEIRADEAADATAVNSDNSTENGEDNEDQAAAHRRNSAGNGGVLKKTASKAARPEDQTPKQVTKAKKFVEDETREQGAVRKDVYVTYLKASGGWPFWILAVSLFLLNEGISIERSWWLRIWTGGYESHGTSFSVFNIGTMFQKSMDFRHGYTVDPQQQAMDGSLAALGKPSNTTTTLTAGIPSELAYYISVYVFLASLSAFFGTIRIYYLFTGSVRASRQLFEKLNFVILRAPLRWLDTVPVGRILNRYTADFNIIDSQLANSLGFGGSSIIRLFGVIIAGVIVSPYTILLSLSLLCACTYYAVAYINAARPAKRIESTAKSPVFELFGTALSGVATIRSFDKGTVYIDRMYRKLDDWWTTSWYLWLFNRWMGWRMSLIGTAFSVVVTSIVLSRPGMSSALAGFALAYALEFSSSVILAVRLYTNVELQMNAAERVAEYTTLPTESLEGTSPPAAWPTEGRIEVEDVVVGYAPDLPPVLKGLSFSVGQNERVGVVGRTGAGKSSLTLALFRFLEARSGTIYIDGIDISKIKLEDLRSRLAIIPQDPVLFSGTIRTNLDPFDSYTDAELRECLARVHLSTPELASPEASGSATPLRPGSSDAAASGSANAKNTNVFDNLNSTVSEGGLNLSQGQRQLLCLARAIVRRPKIMVLDEATSAVDMHTDKLIQRSIREEFVGSTLLVIAHRLTTIADFNRILVLSDGVVAEYGTPQELWEKGSEGVFRGMCEESGERDSLEKIVLGEPSASS